MTRLAALAVLAAALAAFLPGLGAQPVWSRDEARPGLVVREMLATGEWTIPRIGGRVYVEKPPLFTWLAALASRGRATAWSLRLPAALAGAATVAVTLLIGARLLAPEAGLVAAALLASSLATFDWARSGRMESTLVLWITLGFWSLVRWRATGAAREAALLGLWTGLGVLTKGPAALLPLGTGAYLIARDWRRRGRAAAHAGVAIGVAVAVVLCWVGAALAVAPDASAYFNGIGPRLAYEVEKSASRSRLDVFEFVGRGFLPWTLLLPAVVVLLVRRGRAAGEATRVPLLWIGTVLVVFTAVISPREVYFLPLYPALALLGGWAWHVASPGERWWMLAAPAAAVSAVAAYLLRAQITGEPAGLDAGARIAIARSSLSILLTVVVLLAPAGAAVLMRRRRPTTAMLALAAATLLLLAFVEWTVHAPLRARRYPMPAAAARLAGHVPPGGTVAYLDEHQSPALMFYLPGRARQLPEVGTVRELAGRPGTLVLLADQELRAAREMGLSLTILETVQVDRHAYALARVDAS